MLGSDPLVGGHLAVCECEAESPEDPWEHLAYSISTVRISKVIFLLSMYFIFNEIYILMFYTLRHLFLTHGLECED